MNRLSLDNQICFPLYALSRQVTAQYRPLLEKLDLTYPQYLVLLLLWESDNQTVSTIGSRLLLDSGTLTPLLKRLEQKGIITRQRNATDERQVCIELTDGGKSLREHALDIPTQLQTNLNLSNADAISLRDQLATLLNKITNEQSTIV